MRKVRKFSDGQRLEAVLEVINNGCSIKEISRKMNACEKDLGQWIAIYKIHGIDGLFCHGREYTGEFKCKVVEYRKKNNISLSETAAKFCIPTKSTVMKWERVYDKLGMESLQNTKIGRPKITPMNPRKSHPKTKMERAESESNQALLDELEYLRTENAYLKKLRALVQERISRENGNEQEPLKD